MSFLHKSISIGCIVTILVGIPLTSCTQVSQMQTQLMSPEALLKRGQEKSQKGWQQEAIADFTEVIRRNPKNADAYLYRGKARLGADYQGAIADFTEAIRINPKNAEAYLNRALAYLDSPPEGRLNSKNRKNAIPDVEQAIRLNPDYVDAYELRWSIRGLSSQSYKPQDYKDMLADYNRIVRLKPNIIAFYDSRAYIRSSLGDRKGSLADLNEAIRLIRLRPPSEDAEVREIENATSIFYFSQVYNSIATCRYELGDKQGALADFNEAIRIKPPREKFSPHFWYLGRGKVRADTGDNKGAIADFTEVIRLQPDLIAEPYIERGKVRSKLGDKKGAIQDFQKAAQMSRKPGDEDDYKEALQQIQKLQH